MPVYLMALLALAVLGAIGMLMTAAVILERWVHGYGETEQRTPHDRRRGHRWDFRRRQLL